MCRRRLLRSSAHACHRGVVVETFRTLENDISRLPGFLWQAGMVVRFGGQILAVEDGEARLERERVPLGRLTLDLSHPANEGFLARMFAEVYVRRGKGPADSVIYRMRDGRRGTWFAQPEHRQCAGHALAYVLVHLEPELSPTALYRPTVTNTGRNTGTLTETLDDEKGGS